jgi:ParB family chromosome partitioning protein
VGISYGGELQVVEGVVKPEDRKALADLYRSEPKEGDREDDAAPAVDTRRMPDTLVQELTAVRTAALRVELARNPGVALAAVLHPLVLGVFYGHRAYRFSSAVEVSGQDRSLRVAVKDPEACRALAAWNALLEAWTPSLPADPEDLWGWLLGQEQQTLLELLAVVGAANLNATQARQGSDPARMKQAAQVAEAIAFDMRTWWSADVPFLSRLTKLAIADALREAGCTDEAATAVERGAKAEAVALAEKALDGTGWLPEVLRTAAVA